MVDESPDSTDVVLKLFGEGQGLSDESRTTLPEGVVEALNMVGFA